MKLSKEELLKKVIDLYHLNLWRHPAVLNYLVKQRGLTPDILRKFKIGFCTNEAIQNFSRKILTEEHLLKGDSDYFNNYITFPIFDGETPLTIYGRNFSSQGAPHMMMHGADKTLPYNVDRLKDSTFFVVESPIDALTLEQNGFKALAIMGANLSKRSAYLYKGKTCYLLFDSDEAGKMGAEQFCEKTINFAKDIYIIKFPGKYKAKTDANLFFNRVQSASDRLKYLVKLAEPISKAQFPRKQKNNKKIKKTYRADTIDVVRVAEVLFQDMPSKRQGSSVWYRCPIHKEGTEENYSLQIGGDKNIFYCYGCGKGGGSVRFVSLYLGVDYDKASDWIEERFF